MTINEFMSINDLKNYEDLRLHLKNNLLNGRGICAIYACPKCEEMLGDASEMKTHKCSLPNHISYKGLIK